MKTTRTRLLSLLLALAMVFSMLPATAMAVETGNTEQSTETSTTVNGNWEFWSGALGSTKSHAEELFSLRDSDWLSWNEDEGSFTATAKYGNYPLLQSNNFADNYIVQFDFKFDNYFKDTGNYPDRDEGIYIYPVNSGNTYGYGSTTLDRYRIRLSVSQGVQFQNSAQLNGDYGSTTANPPKLTYTGANTNATAGVGSMPTSLLPEVTYTLTLTLSGKNFTISLPHNGQTYSYTYTWGAEDTIGGQFDLRFVDMDQTTGHVPETATFSNFRFTQPVSMTAEIDKTELVVGGEGAKITVGTDGINSALFAPNTTYTTSGDAVSVNETTGEVTAVAAGTATITVTCTDENNSANTLTKTFTVTVNEPAPAKLIEVTDAEGNVTYLENFQGFNTSNVTLKLLADVGDYNLNLNEATGVVLDLNGFTFSKQINLNTGAELTIMDSSDAQTGKVVVDKLTNNTYAAVVIMRGTLTIEGGTIETTGSSGAVQASLATLNIEGGKIVSAADGVQLGTWAFYSDKAPNKVTMTGGEIQTAGKGIVDSDKCVGTTIEITGGKIVSGEDSIAVTTGTAAVSGGTFSTDVSNYCVDGFKTEQNTDGSYGVVNAPAAPTGNIQIGYITDNHGHNGLSAVSGEAVEVNAKESFVVRMYKGDTLVGTATLNDPEKVLLNGVSKTISWHASLTSDGDSWWITEWVGGALKVDSIPDKVELYIDGEKTSEGSIVLNNADNSYPVVAAKVAEDGTIEKFITAATYVHNADYAAALNGAFAEGGNITMLRDVTVGDTLEIPASKTVVLDLNGKTISQTKAQTAGYEMILNDGNLTIKDGVGNGKISYTDSGNGGEYTSNTITNRGTLTLVSGTVENLSSDTVANNGYPYAIDTSIWGAASEVHTIIKGGKVYCQSYSAMRLRGDSATEAVNVTVEGGEIVGTIEVQNSSGAAAAGKLTISGGKLSNSGTANVLFFFGSGNTALEAEITGGEFTGAVKFSSGAYIGDAFNQNFISGGTYSTDVSDFAAEGYEVKANGDGTYGVVVDPYYGKVARIGDTYYATLADAIAAATEGQPVVLLTDATESIADMSNVTLTTDVVGGVTFTNTFVDSEDYLGFSNVKIGTGVTLNVTNALVSGSVENVIEGTLNVTGVYYSRYNAKTTIQNGGKLVTTGMIVNRYHTDAEAGIYVYGDGDASTVEISCGDTIGTYSGTFYAKDAVVEGNMLWIDYKKNTSEEGDTYSQSTPKFENSVLNISSELRLYKDATLTLTGTSVTAGKVQIRQDATPVVTMDAASTIQASSVENLSGATLNAVLGSDGTVTFKKFVAKIGTTGFATLKEAIAAAKENDVIVLLPGTIEEGSVKFPATLKNVTIKGAEDKATILKNTSLVSSDGGTVVYEGITIDGIVFDGSQIVFTGARNGEVIYKDWTITNCEFKNIVSTANSAIHFNLASDETFSGLTFTNNVIDGVSGGNVSGLRANYLSGNITITGNKISNVTWNAIQLINANVGTYTIEDNVLASGAGEGILNLHNTTAEALSVKNNQFLVTEGQTGIGYLTSGDVSGNYWNGEAPENLPDGVTCSNYYTTVNADGTLGGLTEVKTAVAKIGEEEFATLAEAAAAAQSGDEIVLMADAIIAEGTDVTIPSGVTLNGNGFSINASDVDHSTDWGYVIVGGELTIKGITRIEKFSASTGDVVTIGEGASLQIIGSGRMVIGHGATFNITGTIIDAKTADKATLTPSLVMPGASFTGNGVTFNVTNAYIKATAYCSSKNSSANGTFTFNITNSIWEQSNTLVFSVPTSGKDPTVNFYLTNSVLNTTSHLVFGVSKGEIVIDNSNVNVGTSRQIENRSTMTIKNGSVVNGAVATSENAKNPGTIIVDNATYAVTGEFSGSDLGTGKLILKNNAKASVEKISKDKAAVELGVGCELTCKTADLVITTDTGYEVKYENGVYTAVKKTLSGDGSESNPYLIKTVEDLIFFRDSVNAGETTYNAPGVYVALAAEIDMAGATWERGIGDGINATFDGIFDGKNFAIKNLNLAPKADDLTAAQPWYCGGLFGYTYGAAVIKNVVLENITVKPVVEGSKQHFNVGALVGYAYNKGGKLNVSNVTVKNVTIEAPNTYGVGVIVGYSYGDMGTIENCSVDGAAITGYSFVGGITGYSYSNAVITGCSVKNATITATSKGAGGIAGIILGGNQVTGNTVADTTVTASTNWGYVVGEVASEGIVVENNTAAEPQVGGSYSTGEPVEAKIGSKYYTTLEAALEAANAGDVIELLTPYVVEAGEEVTLDLKGATVVGTPTEAKAYAVITNYGTLTITDSVGGGAIVCDHKLTGSTGYAVNTIVNSGNLTIENGTIENKSTSSNQIGYAIDNNSTSYDAVVVIKGGEVKVSGSGYYDGIRLFCNNLTKENSVTVSGGKVSSIWLQNPSDGSAERNTKDVKGSVAITGGEVGALYLEPSSAFTGSITGGTVGSVNAFETAAERDLTGFITGGTFKSDVSAFVAEGYEVKANGDGTYGVVVDPTYGKVAKIGDVYYETLADALAAAKVGDTIVLLADVALEETLVVDKAIIINGEGKKITGADDLIQIKADVTLNNVVMEAGAYDYVLVLKENDCDVVLNDCVVTGPIKGYGTSNYIINSGTYQKGESVYSSMLNGALVYGGTFHYEIPVKYVAPGYVIVDNGDGTWTVKYDPACFIDADNDGVMDEGETAYGSLEALFADNGLSGEVTVVLLKNVATAAVVDTDADTTYNFVTYVDGGVTMDWNYTDGWNYIQKASIGTGVTLNVPYRLCVWTKLDVYGTINTGYFFLNGGETTIREGAVVNANTGETTTQVKNGTVLTVNGTLNTSILNVWAGASRLVVSGENAKVNSSWIDIWDGTPTVTVEDGATLDVENIKASRGGSIAVDDATLKAETIELGHNGESAGALTESGDSDITGEIKMTAASSVVNSDGGLNVTTEIPDHKVVYENGQYKVVAKVYVAEVDGEKYESLAEAIAAADSKTVNLLTDVDLDESLTVNGAVTLDLNGKTISGTHGADYAMIHVLNSGKLTVKDSAGNGKITCAAGGNNTGAAVWVEGELVLESGTIEVTGSWSFGFAVDLRPNAWGTAHTVPASFTMNGGKVVSTDTAVRVASNSSDKHAPLTVSFTMNGGAIESTWDAVFIQHLYKNQLSIEINDGTVSGTNSALRIYGDAVSDVDLTVEGGTFTGALKNLDVTGSGKTAISGGTFSVPVPAEYCADGFVPKDNGDGTYGVAEAGASGTIELKTLSMSLEDVIYLNIYASFENFDSSIDLSKNAGLLVWNENPGSVEEAMNKLEKATKVSGAVASGANYMVRTEGIPAAEWGDDVYMLVYVDCGTTTVYAGKIVCSSPAAEAKWLKNDAKYKDVATAMLNYGAAAQMEFGYKTDTLMNSDLTEEEKALNWNAEWLVPVKAANSAKTANFVKSEKISFATDTLSLEGAINLNFYVNTTVDTVKESGILFWTEEVYDSVDVLTVENAAKAEMSKLSEKQWFGQYLGIPAAKIDETLYVCAYVVDEVGITHYTQVLADSPVAYAQWFIDNPDDAELVNCLKWLVKYGNEAKECFDK